MAHRILVEPGSYPLHNHGDNAMMEIAVERLQALSPKSEILIVTSRPDRLRLLCPSVYPLSEEQRSAWLSSRLISERIAPILPPPLFGSLARLKRHLWMKYPQMSGIGTTVESTILGRTNRPSIHRFFQQLINVDLIVVTGMGLINEFFHDSACALLDELEFALHRNLNVVAFGQGIGPITSPELTARARAVLPKLRLIALRERRYGLPLLESLGVCRDRVVVTGDDAIEYAYRRRSNLLGTRIGVNIRLARYSATDESFLPRLRLALSRASKCLNASLVSVPISLSDESSDLRSIANLLGEIGAPWLDGTPTQDNLLDIIAGCRIVVTGSYHAGVFALAQGIPVVALVQSAYYEQKFAGLSEQFGIGCRIVDFRDEITDAELAEAIRETWECAPGVRGPLLEAAASQIQSSRAAYEIVQHICLAEAA